MPSPRSSPGLRPSSPLSPRYEQSRLDSMLQPPSPRSIQSRTKVSGRRSGNTPLRLPALPRFHPANFPSAHSSYQTTPDDIDVANGPLSPRAHLKLYSEAQKQLLLYHRDSLAAARSTSPMQEKPSSPRLVPLGSPGPVTPLELSADEEYLIAGLKNTGLSTVPRKDIVDTLIQKELRQSSRKSPSSARSR